MSEFFITLGKRDIQLPMLVILQSMNQEEVLLIKVNYQKSYSLNNETIENNDKCSLHFELNNFTTIRGENLQTKKN